METPYCWLHAEISQLTEAYWKAPSFFDMALAQMSLLTGIVATVTAQYQSLVTNPFGDQIFQLGGNITYLATTSSPEIRVEADSEPFTAPATHIIANDSLVTGNYIRDVIASYVADDDVYAAPFASNIIISSSINSSIDPSATDYVASIGSRVILSSELSGRNESFVPGPVLVVANGSTYHISKVFRLYVDTYRTFVDGIYLSNETYKPLGFFEPGWSYPMIPVPSRLYSRNDPRPLAGQRIGVKDIYDIEGLVTTRGSRAYTAIALPSNATAPSVQRIVDLGGVVVGKQKTAQFASAAQGWQWTDAYYPQNPRGDGLLSCSASSSGGGCSIAAYDWLDYAIGTDTGQSVRQPAAFSGTFGNRPSQGLMNLDHVMPIAYGTDTAGFFCRDPFKWVKFAKLWYEPSLHQDASLNGLPELDVPDTEAYPKRIMYPTDHLPLKNPAAETILQTFIRDTADAFGMEIDEFSLTENIESSLKRPISEVLANLNTLWTHDYFKDVATPLLKQYYPEFPALDFPHRKTFRNFTYNDTQYAEAISRRAQDAHIWNQGLFASTNESCSDSMLIYDIGTGGLPSFREADLNNDIGAALAAEPGTIGAPSIMASYFGSMDFTIPIGQVPYFSNVTYQEVMMPVTINIVARRGCDMVMYNFIQALAGRGIIRSVKTGARAFS
ncbi:putative Amidase domain-containing protein [Seiridium unicorne]|uniref:Amidase domain-containing protein n=1 Tax=Seiridium unicorne TaxID=138068 RepID=A0ABR2V360_9PEZI